MSAFPSQAAFVVFVAAMSHSTCFDPALLVVADEQIVGRTSPRPPRDDDDLRYWLENMVWYHRLRLEEIEAALGLRPAEIAEALARFDIRPETRPHRPPDAPLLAMPYPGGRHPRLGFLDGAVDPQRETKISVFTPWDEASYVVLDMPEAIWSNLGLTYLAHQHVPTIWTERSIQLEPLEWDRCDDGSFRLVRRLPNGIEFMTRIQPRRDGMVMRIELTNGTDATLSDLRVQNCALLGAVAGFEEQTNDNKTFRAPYTACHDRTGERWVITAWVPNQRTWGNAACPCLHSDPQFPDCPPGETRHVTGRLWFYQGRDIQAEFDRLDATGWRRP